MWLLEGRGSSRAHERLMSCGCDTPGLELVNWLWLESNTSTWHAHTPIRMC